MSTFKLTVQQDNNLSFTSSAADMCAGETRQLTATPTPVASAQPNSGDLGTFSGTGVSGSVFTAPNPQGGSAVYTITYSFGYCSTTQNITVFKTPSAAVAGLDQTVNANSATMAADAPPFGTGTWSVVSGSGDFADPNSATTTVTNLGFGTNIFRWTVSNGPCSTTMDEVSINFLPPSGSVMYVKANATGANDGTSWADAFTDLQSALTSASPGITQIWVAAGTYKPTNGTDRNSAFVMRNDLAILGGFPNNDNTAGLNDRDCAANETILSGDINTAANTDNCFHVIYNNFSAGNPLNNTAMLDGFTIRDAFSTDVGSPANLGGGVWNSFATPTIRNCVFRENSAVTGGAMFSINSTPIVNNCLFLNNTGTTSGAAVGNGSSAPANFANCIFWGNTGPSIISNQANAVFKNCIIWGNTGTTITNSGSTPVVAYSIVQGGYPGTGNLDVDPLFVNAAGGDFHLSVCSSAIDKGTDSGTPIQDYEGNNRLDAIAGGTVTDIGAYEYQSPLNISGIWYVNANSLVDGNGISWDCATRDLNVALNKAASGDKIWVAAGTYKPTNGTDRNISFSMKDGVTILGGFPNNDNTADLDDRNWLANATILSGDIGTVGINTDNSLRVISNAGLNSSAVLDGFTIRDAFNTNMSNGNQGGGMRNDNASPTILNCIFSNNSVASNGGGVFNLNASPTFTNCLFTANSANSGGAMGTQNGNPVLINCTLTGNNATLTGGALDVYSFNNNASNTLKNCIVWDNTAPSNNPFLKVNTNSIITVSHSIVQGRYPGTGNLEADPLFANAAGGDFRLQDCSPAIDAGLDTDNSATKDLDGNSRKFDAFSGRQAIDMGTYEYQSSVSTNGIWYVNANSPVAGNGTSWDCAARDLQVALSKAESGDNIWVAAGTYKPTSGTDRSSTFAMKKGVAMLGGFPDNDNAADLNDRDWVANVTILSGDINTAANTDNCIHVIYNVFSPNNPMDSTAVLDGFTIRDGFSAEDLFVGRSGAGMANIYASPTIRNCIFRENSAITGGGMFNGDAAPIVSNCLFLNNKSNFNGAAVISGGLVFQRFNNCTFFGNTGANIITNQFNTTMKNCIVWGNTGTPIINFSNSSSPNVTHSIVQGGYVGVGNLDVDPLFINAAGGDFHLSICSPAIDGGTDTGVPNLDYEGNNRVDAIAGGTVADIGAYEYQSSLNTGIWYVNANSPVNGKGKSWDCPIRDLQEALAKAESGDAIWVAAGTYKPTNGTDRNSAFVMKNGVTILGGFPNNDNTADLNDRDWAANPTILSGDIGSIGTNSDNTYRVISNNGLDNTAVLDGFTVRDGYNPFSSANTGNAGGIWNENSSANFSNCIIRNNYSANSGGGAAAVNSFPTFTNCSFIENIAEHSGGAISGQDGITTLVNCTIYNNSANNEGRGAIYNSRFMNTTGAVLKNCIVWENSVPAILNNQGTFTTVTHSIVQGGAPGTGNLDTDPLFFNAAGGDFRLQACSPAIDAGLDTDNSTSKDLGGATRKYQAITGGEAIDMGAYEYQQGAPMPIAVCKNITVYLSATSATVNAVDVDNGSSADCGGTLSINGQPSLNFVCSDIGQNTVTLAMQGAQNNRSATCTAIVTVTDNTSPTAVCQNITVNLSGSSVSITPGQILNTAASNDNCGTVSAQSVSLNSFTCANIGPNTVTLIANDGKGNTATCTAVVIIQDNTPPTAVCQNIMVNLSGSPVSITPNQILNAAASGDNCGTVSAQSVSPNSFTCANTGQNIVTLVTNDGKGNTATCTAVVTVVDNMLPTAVCQNITVNLSGSSVSITPGQILNTAASGDNCGTVSAQSVSPNSFTCANTGQNTVTLIANDGKGNTTTCTASVTVQDNTPPSIVCPANIIRSNDAGQCGATVTYAQPVATDNCGGSGLDHLGGGLSGSTFLKGTTMVNWMATDAANNTATCSFTVTVTDAQAPNIACPANQAVATDIGQCYATVSFVTPSGSDNCALPPNAVTQTTGPASGSTFPKGTNTLTFKVTDAVGLTKTCSFRIIVNDTQNPTINCPSTVSVPAAMGQCSAVVTYSTPTATDNCTPAPTVVRIGGTASGGTVAVGNSTAIWRAIDGAGRSSTCTISITVTDNQSPAIVCPQNIAQANPPNACNAPVFYPTPTATDNCGINAVFMVEGMASGSSFPIGATSVVWRAVDNNTLSTTCSFNVTVFCGTEQPDPTEALYRRSPDRRAGLLTGIQRYVLSPNPTTESVDITWEGFAPEQVAIFDVQGRLVWEQSTLREAQMLRVAVSDWNAGVYWVSLREKEAVVTKRLVVGD